MKTTTAKSKKSTIVQKVIAGILTGSIALFSSMPVYAGTTVDQETLYPILKTTTQEYLYPVTGNTSTIYRYTSITDVLSQFAEQSTFNQKFTYTLLNSFKDYIDGIEGYIDGIEGFVDGIEGKIDTSNTHLNAIKGYVDGIEGYVDNLETLVTTSNTHLNAIKGYVDGIEGKIDTSNTRLNDIKSAIQNITTYDYTSILTDIQTNMLHVPTIDQYVQSIQDSIGYGNSIDNVLTNLNSVNGNLGQIYGDMSYWDDSSASSMGIAESTYKTYKYLMSYTANTSAKSRWRSNQYGNIVDSTSNNGFYNINGFAYPTLTTDSISSGDQYRYKINTSNNITMLDGLENLSIIGNFTLSKLYTPNTRYTYMIYDEESNSMVPYKNSLDVTISALSIMDIITHYGQYSLEALSKLQYMLADDDSIQAKNANKAQEQAVLTNFTGQGSASASASDFGELSNAVGSVKSGLNTNASPSDVLTVFNSTDGFGWFSQATLDALDTTSQNTRQMKGGSNTPLYDSNYNAIMEYLTGGEKK